MNEDNGKGDVIRADISGPVEGQVAVGKNIHQQSIRQAGVSESDVAELRRLLAELREKVQAEAPDELQEAAAERVDELEEAITGEEPDPSAMKTVAKWFAKRLPQLGGAVTSLVVNPLVGKLVEAAGDAVAAEVWRRLGKTKPPGS